MKPTNAIRQDPARRGSTQEPGYDNVDVTLAGSYFEGVCSACPEPERGGIVALFVIGSGQGRLVFRLCPDHFTRLREKMLKLGAVRDI